MFDFESRHIIEALRSGVPSRTVGRCFSEARAPLLSTVQAHLDDVRDNGKSSGMIIRGRYGEGKTHLLNTVFSMAFENNMVVSLLPLTLENPMDKMHTMYPALVNHTYLPGREQPGFLDLLNDLSLNSDPSNVLQLFALKELECDKLYYVLRTYLSASGKDDVQFPLRADLEGDFIANPALKKMYRTEFKQVAKFNTPFGKTLHTYDYIAFLSKLFEVKGYNGWVILFDEAELMGRLGKKARLNFYKNMNYFLHPQPNLINTFTLFTFTNSYLDEVIDGKHDLKNLGELFPDKPEPIRTVINDILASLGLASLNQEEILHVVSLIRDYHSKAYNWTPASTDEQLQRVADAAGNVLRTRLRSVLEYLDQEYQYGDAKAGTVGALETESFEEVPSLEEMDTNNYLEPN